VTRVTLGLGIYAVRVTCPVCGAVTPEGARFCPSCGHQLVAQIDERRVVTVLFADLVGYTGMAENRDPEQVKALIDRLFEALVDDIRSFGGRVDKILGDAILALFGAPVAHEDDAERAVRAALRMQETIAKMSERLGMTVQMRIGINTGEVLTGALRAGGDYTAMGDVVNTASRLQNAAVPGEVWVGNSTYSATADSIKYDSVGALTVKGRDDLVAAWRALAPEVPPGYRRQAFRTPLIGRAREMDLIGQAIDAVVERRKALLVTLIGDAGVGKSRLALEVGDFAHQRHEALVWRGRAVAYGEANVWWPIAEAIRTAVGATMNDAPTTVRQRLRETLVDTLGFPPDSKPESEVERLTNGIVHLMGFDGPLRGIDPRRAREEVARSLVRFLEAYLELKPVMMVIADLHWAGSSVLELLAVLLERLVDKPFILLTTQRPHFRESWAPADGRHNSLVVNVDPLGRGASRTLLEALSDDRMAPEVQDVLLERSAGNPLFLEELMGLVSDSPGHVNPASLIDGDRLPDSLRGLVAARLDGLTQPERRALEDAAVYGRQGTVEALVLMAAADRAGHGRRGRTEVETAVSGLAEKDILVLNEEGTEYTFRTELVRDVTYTMMTKAARALRHWGIGEFLKRNYTWGTGVSDAIVDALAHHFAAAAQLAKELGGVAGIPASIVGEALEWLIEAARRAEANAVPVVAERLYDRAVALAPPLPTAQRATLLLGRGRARSDLRWLEEARADVDEAMSISTVLDDDSGVAKALLVRGSIEDREGRVEEALASFVEAENEFRRLDDKTGMAEALRLRGMVELLSGNLEDARSSMSAALDVFGAIADKRGEAWALQNLAWVAFQSGRPSEADRQLQESLEKFAEIGDSGGYGWATGLQGWVRFHQGRWEEAEALGEGMLVEARGRGDRWAEAMMLLLTASLRLWTGRSVASIDRANDAVETFKRIGDLERELQAASVLGRALIAAGRISEGFKTIDLAIEQRRFCHGGAVESVPTAAAAAAVYIGDPKRALQNLALITMDGLDPSVVGEGDRLVAFSLAKAQLGDTGVALARLRESVSSGLEEFPSGYALSALALLYAMVGDHAQAIESADRVFAAEQSTYLDRIWAHLALASMWLGIGTTEEGVAHFDSAASLAAATDDQVASALVSLARSEAHLAAGTSDPLSAADAARRLADLGIDGDGWRLVYRTIVVAAR